LATSGKLITAGDYNVLVNITNKVFADVYPGSIPKTTLADKIRQGYGWGNPSASSAAQGTKITAVLVNQLIDRINLGAEHTGSVYELDRVITGQKITANIWNDIETVAADVDMLHNSSAPGQTALTSLGNIVCSTGFQTDLSYTVNLQFDNFDKARYFFNSDGSINLSLTGTGSGASSLWQDVYARIGIVSIKLTNTTSTTANIISENKGFRDLGSMEQLLLTCNSRSGTGYGYGYGYGTGSNSYGNGGNNSNNAYGYGYGGSTRSIQIYGSIIANNANYISGPVTIVLRVVLHSADSTEVNGIHTLHVESNKATTKTSGDATFNITQPVFSGTYS
jgi:hypothetical protein